MFSMRITFFISLLYFISTTVIAQTQNEDSIKVKEPFDSFIIKNTAYLNDTTNSFKYSEYIWSDKRSISEVMDQRPGYFVFDFFGLGGRNAIVNNAGYLGVFRDAIQINDVLYGGFDVEIFSINEVEAIEEISAIRSLLYGVYTFGRSFNVITKDYFTPLPFSQLRYSQDRSNSLFADVFYSQAYSKKFGLQFGITKHSLDGRFENSAFDTWKTRTRFSFNPSDRVNLKANFYYNYIERGLNGGVNRDVVDQDSLLSGNAHVVYPDYTEKSEHIYYDVNLFARLFNEKKSETKINFYSQNIARTDLSGLNNPHLNKSTHYINYGINTTQNFFINHSNEYSSNIIARIDYLTYLVANASSNLNILSLKAAYETSYKQISFLGIYRYDFVNEFSYSSYGLETDLIVHSNRDFQLNLLAGFKKYGNGSFMYSNLSQPQLNIITSKSENIDFEAGLKIKYHELEVTGFTGRNAFFVACSYRPEWLSLSLIYNKSFKSNIPDNYVKGDISYIGNLFDNNLRLRTGFDFKYYNIKDIVLYNQTTNSLSNTENSFPRENQFVTDFYIGARIGNANINLTVANIFNSLVYNAYIYPLDNRGGLLNAISRFTIVWDFLN